MNDRSYRHHPRQRIGRLVAQVGVRMGREDAQIAVYRSEKRRKFLGFRCKVSQNQGTNVPETHAKTRLVRAKPVNLATAESMDRSLPAVRDDFIKRLQARDTDAFDQWVLDESPGVYRMVSRLLSWQQDCDDVVQDVFVIAWRQIGRFRGNSDIRTWLYGIAINRCRRQRRSYFRSRSVHRQLDREMAVPPADASSNPSVQQIRLAISCLSQRDREVIVLCGIQQTPIRDVAKILGLRKNTVEVRLHRARQRLKQILSTQKAEHDR